MHRFAMAAVTTLVYPLHRLIGIALLRQGRRRTSAPSSPPTRWMPPLLSALAVLSTAVVPVWSVALWGGGRLEWGLASGLSVGVLSASLSLKSISFAQCWCRGSSSSSSSSSSSPSPFCDGTPPCAGKPGEMQAGGQEKEQRDLHRPPPPVLTYGEFLVFLLCSPTLVRVVSPTVGTCE